jgi:hypothetical protein
MVAQRFGPPTWHRRIASVLLLSAFLGCVAAPGRAAGLECPEVGSGEAPNLLAHVKQPQFVASASSADLANETTMRSTGCRSSGPTSRTPI